MKQFLAKVLVIKIENKLKSLIVENFEVRVKILHYAMYKF